MSFFLLTSPHNLLRKKLHDSHLKAPDVDESENSCSGSSCLPARMPRDGASVPNFKTITEDDPELKNPDLFVEAGQESVA